jgi:NAD(P)-dependent dehydrogenase (short-subunit alcohol dehydrogenase family)
LLAEAPVALIFDGLAISSAEQHPANQRLLGKAEFGGDLGMLCEGKAAVVTGAAGGGMGRSIALTLAHEGAQVAVNYRTSADSANAMVDHIGGRGGGAIAVEADVFQAEGCRKLVGTTVEKFGRVDICIVNPGASWHTEPIDKLDPTAALDDVHREMAPLVHLMPLLLPGMYERKWGRLIGITVHPTPGPAHSPGPSYSYFAGKAARTQALLLAQHQAWASGVTVNTIAPGPVGTITSLEEAVEQCNSGLAWRKRTTVSPQDVAEGVAFLCSEAGRFVTGCVLPYLR